MALRTALSESLVALADEIRSKGGTHDQLFYPEGFIQAINNIDAGSGINWKSEFTDNLAGNNSEIPDNMTALRNYAFYHSDVASLDFSGTDIETIGTHCFEECSSLTSLDLSDCESLTTIGEYALYYSGVQTLDLSGCSGLVTIGDHLASNGNNNVSDPCYITALDLSDCTSLQTIGQYAFGGRSMQSLLLPPQMINSIGSYAFAYQSGITGSLTINAGTLGADAFHGIGCSSITIKNCDRYYAAVFADCSNLTEVRITTTPTGAWPSNITTYPVFNGCSNLADIYVPWSSGDIAENKFVKSSQHPTWHYDTVF